MRLGVATTAPRYTAAQQAALADFVHHAGSAYQALPADTLLAIINAGDAHTRVTFQWFNIFTNPQKVVPWPFTVSQFPDSVKAALWIANPTGDLGGLWPASAWPNPQFIGGQYGLYVSLSTMIPLIQATWENPKPDIGTDGSVFLPSIGFQFQTPVKTVSDSDGTYTRALTPDELAATVQPQYDAFFKPLFSQGLTQVMTTRWNVSAPDTHQFGYRDARQIHYDPLYGLVTPASNVILPVQPDTSLQDLLTFISIAVAAYGAVTLLGNAVTASEALAAPSVEDAASSSTDFVAASPNPLNTLYEAAPPPSIGQDLVQVPNLDLTSTSLPDVPGFHLTTGGSTMGSQLLTNTSLPPGVFSSSASAPATANAPSQTTASNAASAAPSSSLITKATGALIPALTKTLLPKSTTPAAAPALPQSTSRQPIAQSALLPVALIAALILWGRK